MFEVFAVFEVVEFFEVFKVFKVFEAFEVFDVFEVFEVFEVFAKSTECPPAPLVLRAHFMEHPGAVCRFLGVLDFSFRCVTCGALSLLVFS